MGRRMYSKDPHYYRVKEGNKIIAYGHTPEEAVRKANKKGVRLPNAGYEIPFGFNGVPAEMKKFLKGL